MGGAVLRTLTLPEENDHLGRRRLVGAGGVPIKALLRRPRRCQHSVPGARRPSGRAALAKEFETKSFDAHMDLRAFLEQLFGRPVDLVLKDAIKPRLQERILADTLHAPGL